MEGLLEQILSRLGAIEKKLGVASSGGGGDERSALAVDFEATIVKGVGAALIESCKGLGDDGAKMAGSFSSQFAFALKVLDMSAKCRKPAADELPALYSELKAASKALFDLSGPKGTKDGDLSNALRGMEQGSSAFGWPLDTTSTVACVAQGFDSSGLFVQRASKAAKDAGKAPLLAVCLAYNAALKAMQEWVKENAKSGVVWNAKGVAPKDFAPGAAAAPAPAAPAAPAAAAPAPSAAAAPAAAPAAAAATPNLGALFSSIASIDQSSGKTAGLRHVTKDMKSSASKTEGGSVVAALPAKATASSFTGGGGIKMGTPKLAEEGMRWVVEFHTKDTQKGEILAISGASLKQEVYIYGCKDVVIDITTKVKGVRLDGCHNVTLLVQGALSGMEVVNSKRMKLQVKDKLPSVAIDKTDGCVVGLPWVSRDTVITSSKSSEMNVTFPTSDSPDADWIERCIPEQFVSHVGADNKVTTGVSELYSS